MKNKNSKFVGLEEKILRAEQMIKAYMMLNRTECNSWTRLRNKLEIKQELKWQRKNRPRNWKMHQKNKKQAQVTR